MAPWRAAGLYLVHARIGQRACDLELFLRRESNPRGLLAVPQRRIVDGGAPRRRLRVKSAPGSALAPVSVAPPPLGASRSEK